MPFAAALSAALDTDQALDEVCAAATAPGVGAPDLAVVFFSPAHAGHAGKVAAAVRERLGPRHLIGCVGESIVGGDREVEHSAALSLWLGSWGGAVELEPFHLTPSRTPDGLSLLGWPDSLIESDASRWAMLTLADPFTFPVDTFLPQVNDDYKGLRVMGGMASGSLGPGQTPLLLNEKVVTLGAVGVLLRGPLKLRSVVSQGCRPIGRHLVITKGHDNVILELGGRPPLAYLQELWKELPKRDQELFQRGLHIGLVMNEYRDTFGRGDFLVRNLYGLDKQTGALAITDRIRVGQTVQFHVRDADTADEDLKALLRADGDAPAPKPAGALLFTCNGRGTRMFADPSHDAQTIQGEVGPLPLAGFFAAGELGPVGGQNFIHGFTASVVLFEE